MCESLDRLLKIPCGEAPATLPEGEAGVGEAGVGLAALAEPAATSNHMNEPKLDHRRRIQLSQPKSLNHRIMLINDCFQ